MISRVSADVMSDRALNRATLERQLLLRRASLTPLETVEHLVGLQAQVPLAPYTALWSRLDGFRLEELGRLLEERVLVRIVVMRGTIHLVTADDALALRPLTQPVLDGQLARHGVHKAALAGVDLEPVVQFARAFLEVEPRTGSELRAALAERLLSGVTWSKTSVAALVARSRSIRHVPLTKPSCSTVPWIGVGARERSACALGGRKRARSACESSRLS